LREHIAQLLAAVVRDAVVERDDLPEERQQLHRQGLVEAPLVPQLGDRLGRRVGAERDAHRIFADRVEQHEHQDRDPEQDRDRVHGAADGVGEHGYLAPGTPAAFSLGSMSKYLNGTSIIMWRLKLFTHFWRRPTAVPLNTKITGTSL
jgi:hypothetical protein